MSVNKAYPYFVLTHLRKNIIAINARSSMWNGNSGSVQFTLKLVGRPGASVVSYRVFARDVSSRVRWRAYASSC
jgi:hypothetical protein